MPKTPNQKHEIDKATKEEHTQASWGEDQKKHEYYYDDSHGYETYIPTDIDEENEVERPAK